MSDQIRSLIAEYAAAWRRGDADSVLALFTDDAVILPHDGVEPRVGHDTIRAFWFSAARGTTGIDQFDFDVSAINERGDNAIAWGKKVLQYWQLEGGQKVTRRWPGTFLMALRREAASWRITHFMWDDPAPELIATALEQTT